MPLRRDQVLGEYRIVEPIGAGGMGEVYRARDTRLDRDVAIKVLPDALARDPQAQARFEREAKAIAALSHPNILAVYDYGSIDGVWYVVTELLEGDTLRTRLAEGVLAPRKAAELGQQMARGLAAAHDKGIVHRDLKPENLYVTRDGRIKILDFGLALTGRGPEGRQDQATRITLTTPGTLLGTVGYMSPEQVRGEPADTRSDIFSFGAVLYEMLSGSRPFQRETAAETMTAILREEPPDLSSVPADIPPALGTIVRRCLEKQPGERYQSAHDLAFSLESISTATTTSGAVRPAAGIPGRRPRPSAVWAIGLVMAGLLLGAAAAALLVRPESSGVPRIDVLSARRGAVTGGRFLPGGQAVVYSAIWEGGAREVFTASVNTGTQPMSFQGADLLSVSSTGELALGVDRRPLQGWEVTGTLAVASAQGSAPRPVLENVLAADWSPDGQSLAVAHEVGGIVRLEFPIGTVVYESQGWISDLRVHPDGERVAFADNPVRGDNVATIRIVDRAGNVEDLGPGASWGLLWAPGGEEILAASGLAVFAIRPGGGRRALYSAPISIRLLDVDTSGRLLISAAAVQREMFGRAPGETVERNLSWQDWTTPRSLLPDGRSVVFEEGNQGSSDGYAIYLRGTDGSPPIAVGNGSLVATSPDGRWLLVIQRPFGDDPRPVLMPTGPGTIRPLGTLGELRLLPRAGDWIPGSGTGDDPGAVVVTAAAPGEPARLYRLEVSGSKAPQPISPAGFPIAPQGIAVSPDDRGVVARPVAGPAVRFPMEGGDPQPVPGVADGDLPLGFDTTGRHLYVQASSAIPSPIVRIDIETGVRTPWLELKPADPAGVFTADYPEISDDGSAYIYSSRRLISRLVILSGLL